MTLNISTGLPQGAQMNSNTENSSESGEVMLNGLLKVIQEKWEFQERLKSSILTCPSSCNDFSQITFEGEKIKCPLLSLDCTRGKKRLADMNQSCLSAVRRCVPPLYADAITRPQVTQTTETVMKWNWKQKPFLVLLGKKGIGKSFSASLAFWRWAKSEVYGEDLWKNPEEWRSAEEEVQDSLLWLNAFDISMVNFYARTGENDPNIFTRAKWLKKPFLIIDDLAVEDATEQVKSKIHFIVNQRYENCLPMVITSNLDKKQFFERYGERLAERILEVGEIDYCEGKNFRQCRS